MIGLLGKCKIVSPVHFEFGYSGEPKLVVSRPFKNEIYNGEYFEIDIDILKLRIEASLVL